MTQTIEVYISPEVAAVRRLHNHVLARREIYFKLRDQLFMLAENLHAEHRRGNPDTCIEIGTFHPDFVGSPSEVILQHSLSLEEARMVVALGHGFISMKEAQEEEKNPFDHLFEKAIDAVVKGDIMQLRELLDERPDLIEVRSAYGHGATLLHYCAANGVELYRQCVPSNLLDILSLLFDRGSSVESVSFCYGGLYTIAALTESGIHHKAAGNYEEVLAFLAKYGA